MLKKNTSFIKMTVLALLILISQGCARIPRPGRSPTDLTERYNMLLIQSKKAQGLKDWYVSFFQGAEVYSDEPEPVFLGRIAERTDEYSIFNEMGTYGDKFGPLSIWNRFGKYGGEFSLYSPFNPFTDKPPYIVRNGRKIGRLSVNEFLPGAMSPYWLK